MIYIRENVKEKIKLCITMTVIAVLIAVACFAFLAYQVKGERKVPFEIGKIIVISSATSQSVENNKQENSVTESAEENADIQKEEEKFIWDEQVIQTNDVYIYLDKNNKYKGNNSIKKVQIENVRILENVKIGKIQVYMPNSLNDGLYKYTDDYLIGATLSYRGASADNKKTLEINNQGGCICISFANMGLERFKSNDGNELPQGGNLLKSIGLNDDELKFKVCFDLIIEVDDRVYKTEVTLDMPANGVTDNKESFVTIDNFEDVVYKRIK